VLKLTTDRHEASRGLFATAELLVPTIQLQTVAHGFVSLRPSTFTSFQLEICGLIQFTQMIIKLGTTAEVMENY